MDPVYEECGKETTEQSTTPLSLSEIVLVSPLKSSKWAKTLQTLLNSFWQGHV